MVVKRKIDGMVEEHWNAQVSKMPSKSPNPSWCPPPSPWLKCNTDVAIKPTCTTLAAVFRDGNDSVVHARTWRAGILDPTEAEAEAVLHAVEETIMCDFQKVIFEGDALQVFGPLKDWSLMPGWLIQNSTDFVKTKLSNRSLPWSSSKVPRVYNFVAHIITQ